LDRRARLARDLLALGPQPGQLVGGAVLDLARGVERLGDRVGQIVRGRQVPRQAGHLGRPSAYEAQNTRAAVAMPHSSATGRSSSAPSTISFSAAVTAASISGAASDGGVR